MYATNQQYMKHSHIDDCHILYFILKCALVLQCVMNMPEEDPRRIESIRKYSAIYGRFDCKRKPEKPLTLHEVNKPSKYLSINIINIG